MIERDQQRYIARDDLWKRSHGGADLRGARLISQQAGLFPLELIVLRE